MSDDAGTNGPAGSAGPVGGDDPRTRADTLDVERASGLTIVFGDGHECFFANDELRRGCPCATCRDLRTVGEVAWPAPGQPEEIAILNAELVGGWGISFAWSDGHGTGIFPFGSLRTWCEAKDADAPDDDRTPPDPGGR